MAAGVSSLLFLTAIRTIGGTRTGILMLFEPVVGVVLAALLLREPLLPVQLAGRGARAGRGAGAPAALGARALARDGDRAPGPVV